MSRDDDNLCSPSDESMDAELQTSDALDLNIDQDSHSPNTVQVSSSQFSNSAKDGPNRDGVLKIGTEFESDEHAYVFYKKYAKIVGFSVRKDWVNRSKVHGLVVSRKFTCSREGYRRKDKRDLNVKKHRKETRTGCLAHMIITRQPDGKYRVTQFEAEHNHGNLDPNNVETLLLQRELCAAQVAENFPCNSRTESNSTFELMNRRLEVQESLDYLALDFDNYLRSERIRDMKEGEAGRLLRYLQRQHIENPSFFHAIQVDINDKVSNIFWADDKMVMDYDHFGDVVCLDASYHTNKGLHPFVQFIGVNHHNNPIIFAAALLFDDTVESLKWLFNTFVDAMSGKKPKVILTDQDAIVVEAINSVLPETSHRICVWQMYCNALKHLSHAVRDIKSFTSDFRSCMYDHCYEEAFVQAWDSLLEKHGLQQNEWLRWMFREKEKWSIVYGRNTFFLDNKGSHLVEVLSNHLRRYLNPDQDVLQFIKSFERVVEEQRLKEIQANNEMSTCMPRLMGNVVLLKHASDIYTPNAFEIFQMEYEKSLNAIVNQCNKSAFLLEYKVNIFGQTQDYAVTFNSSDDTIVCSCMKFENVGFLCSHALKVLDNRNIKVLPSQYILKRWTKDARIGRVVRDGCEFIAQENPKLIAASRYRNLNCNILKLSARAAESEEAFQFVLRQLDELIEGVEKILMSQPEGAQGITSSTNTVNVPESENAEYFLDEKVMEDQDKNNRVQITKEKESVVPDTRQLKYLNGKSSKEKRFQHAEPPSPNTVNHISSPPQACVSTEAPNQNPLLQGLYNFEANQAVQSMYQHEDLVMDHRHNTNLYQQSNFHPDRHDSPGQTSFQDSLIHGAYTESLANSAQLRQAMDLDLQRSHSSSILLYGHRFRASSTSYPRLKER